VLASENIALTALFTEEEIKTAIFSMNPNKAPSPDGFPILFYHNFWNIIKYDILQFFTDFYHHKLDISKFNRALICLIPKVSDIKTIKYFFL
jgi:hypothetical protein